MDLLIDGAKTALTDDELLMTKPWRRQLWNAFREIETRLCPRPEDFR